MSKDLVTALSLLPGAYAEAVRLQVAGATAAEIGDALGLEPAAVGPMLSVADVKLRELLSTDDPVVDEGEVS